MARRRTRPTGFTLIEILVVVVILSIMAAGVAPSFFRSIESLSLKSAARHLTDMMNFCQSMAAFEAQEFRFNIQEQEDEGFRCWVSFERQPLEEPGSFVPYGASGYSTYRLGKGIVFQAAVVGPPEEQEDEYEQLFIEKHIAFRPDGTTDGAVLVLANEHEEKFSILVSSLTGRVRIIEGDIIEQREEEEAEEEAEWVEDESWIE